MYKSPDYYKILNVPSTASQREIELMYKTIESPSYDQKEAFETLMNENSRKKYDAVLLFEQKMGHQIDTSQADTVIGGLSWVVTAAFQFVIIGWVTFHIRDLIPGIPDTLAFLIGIIAFVIAGIIVLSIHGKIMDKRDSSIRERNRKIYVQNKMLYEKLTGEPYDKAARHYEIKVFDEHE